MGLMKKLKEQDNNIETDPVVWFTPADKQYQEKTSNTSMSFDPTEEDSEDASDKRGGMNVSWQFCVHNFHNVTTISQCLLNTESNCNHRISPPESMETLHASWQEWMSHSQTVAFSSLAHMDSPKHKLTLYSIVVRETWIA